MGGLLSLHTKGALTDRKGVLPAGALACHPSATA
jgi:hypothetical protein